MYATVLRLMALCYRLFVKSTAKRAAHALFKNDVSDLLMEVDKLEEQVDHETQICEYSRSQEADAETQRLLGILREPILRTDHNVLSLLERVEKRERLEILDWMSKVLYGANHETVAGQRTTDTCEWLLNHRRFREWHESSASIVLWLAGNRELKGCRFLLSTVSDSLLKTAGTGKTFLTSKVIDEILDPLKSKPNQEGFAFFYCNRNEAERRQPVSVLRAFVRQLSTIASDEQSIQLSIKRYAIDTQLKASEPTIDDCKKLLLDFINIYPRTTLVLDALDECELRNRLQIIEVFDYLLAESSQPLKIFISSRPDQDIKKRLKDRASIEIGAQDNCNDITKFVKSRICQHSGWHTMDAKLQTKIITTIQDKSQGM
jgi:hypothetical protein